MPVVLSCVQLHLGCAFTCLRLEMCQIKKQPFVEKLRGRVHAHRWDPTFTGKKLGRQERACNKELTAAARASARAKMRGLRYVGQHAQVGGLDCEGSQHGEALPWWTPSDPARVGCAHQVFGVFTASVSRQTFPRSRATCQTSALKWQLGNEMERLTSFWTRGSLD